MTTKSNNNKKLKLIAVDEKNYNVLRMLGHVPDSFNDVVTRLIAEHCKGGIEQTK